MARQHDNARATPGQPVPTQLDAVTTAATRTRRPLDDVPATVSVITTEDIDRENMQDVRDLVRNEPGVTVGNNPFRAGYQNFLIRGIGGNRVLLMVDGMRLPDFPDSTRVPAPTRASSLTWKTSSAWRSSAAPPRRSTAPMRSAASSPTPPRIRATT
jgi:outer membrane receptor for ferrienterochelin and colicin